MTNKLYTMPFSNVYPLYIAKVEKKNIERTKLISDRMADWVWTRCVEPTNTK